MIDTDNYQQLKDEIQARMAEDRAVLDQLRADVRPLRSEVRAIQFRTTTSISLVGTDGGNNRIEFDPFLVQLVRVVDSSNNEYCLDVITPTTDTGQLSARQFGPDGAPKTPLGAMMRFLDLDHLAQLSPMIPKAETGRPISPSWVQVYRELVEWATLFSIIRDKDFGTDTLIIFDGFLRSKVFARDLFARLCEGIHQSIVNQWQRNRREILLAGVAKHSKVLTRYRLAMALEQVLSNEYPAYVEVPRELEERTYIWSEYARGDDRASEGGEINKFVGGKMFFAKFGPSRHDPIWPIDIFLPQLAASARILGSMYADALNGFPVPFYPQCLQKAHANAALVDFDFDVLQDQIFDAIRTVLADLGPDLDVFRLQDADPGQRRYQ